MGALHLFEVYNCKCLSTRLKSFFLYSLHSSFHLACHYLLLSVVWSPSSRPPFLALWFCSGDFISLLHRSSRLTAKLRYENKQLALELTGEKKSATNAPSQALLFAFPADAKP